VERKQAAIAGIVLAAVATGVGLTWKYHSKLLSKFGLSVSEEPFA